MVSTTKRRRFQASITSFFTSEAPPLDNTSIPWQGERHQESLSSPQHSDEIQSSLLTVGMRIRKSIPEGYKTHKSHCSTPLYEHSKHPLDWRVQENTYNTDRTSSSAIHGGCAELAPFCGLHKIGGMAVQPIPALASDIYPYAHKERTAEQVEEPALWSSLPSSQESAYSNAPPPLSNKRTFAFDQDEDGVDDDCLLGNDFPIQQPASYPFSHTRMPDLNTLLPSPNAQSFRNSSLGTARAFAIPRTRFPSSKDKKPALEGQENLGLDSKSSTGITTAFNGETDFEDADFLKEREDVDIDNLMDGC